MKKILLFLFAIASLPYLASSQEYEVKWGGDMPETPWPLRLDKNEFYTKLNIFKKNSLSPRILKFDYNHNILMNNDLMSNQSKEKLHRLFSLKDYLVSITRLDEKDSTSYIATLINNSGNHSEPRFIFKTKKSKDTSPSARHLEKSIAEVRMSEDSSKIVVVYNHDIDVETFGQKVLNSMEVLRYAVFNTDFQELTNREINFSYKDELYELYNYLYSKNDNLITFGHLFEKNVFDYYKKRGGEYIPEINYLINIFGNKVGEEKEIILPQDQYKFYYYTQLKIIANNKLILVALCANSPYEHEALIIAEIDESNSSISPAYYKIPIDIIEIINKANNDKDNNIPSIAGHHIRNIEIKSNGEYIFVLERNYVNYSNIIILETKNKEINTVSIVKKSEEVNKTLGYNSFFSFFKNDSLFIYYNEPKSNYSGEKTNMFKANSTDTNIIELVYSGNKIINKRILNKNALLEPASCLFQNNKALLVIEKDKHHQFGVIEF